MRKATKKAKARSGGDDQISSLERSMGHLEKLVLDIEQRVREYPRFRVTVPADEPHHCTVTVHKWQTAPDEPSLKDAAPPTMTTPTRRTVMDRLSLLETADELLDAQHREFATVIREDFETLSERLRKVEAALGEV